MTAREARGARARGVTSGPPQTLIHRTKSPNPHGCSLSGPLVVRYGLEWGVSPATVETAFRLAVALIESERSPSHAAVRLAVSLRGGADAKSTP